MPNDATVSYQEDPTHMIIWLDVGIGDPEKYQQLKKAFSTQADPKHETPVQLVDKDYADILDVEGPLPVNFEGVYFLLAAFTNIDNCIHCFEQNQDKRIFFITSGSLGMDAVPIILERFKKTFTDSVTDRPYASIYVFCHNLQLQIEWAMNYLDYLQVFNFDADLLVRMIRDIGNYFFTESRYLLDEKPPNNEAAYHRLNWARKLYERYGEIEKVSMKKEINEVNEHLGNLEEELRSSSDEDD